MNRGVVYACSHPRWLPEAVRSSASVQRHMPDLSRELFITPDLLRASGDGIRSHFTNVRIVTDAAHPHRPRFDSLVGTKLDEALFLDGDTLVLAPVYELFDVLRDFDIGIALAPQYLSPQAAALGVYDRLPVVSAAQPEWNSGVIVARMDDAFRTFAADWSILFTQTRADGHKMDQAALRSALVRSRLRIAPLPNNYNFRANVPNTITGEVKILHAHGDLERIAAYINAERHMRIYRPMDSEIDGFKPK